MKKAAQMTMLLMATPRLTLAFSSSGMKRHVATLLQAASAKVEPLAAPRIDASNTNNELLLKSFNPLGPPEELSGLSLGQTIHLHDKDITRLSSSPDIFLIKDLIPKDDRTTLIQAAESQGIMKIAGTRQSGENTIRKNSFISWIDPYTLSSNKDEGENDDWREAPTVARETILKSRLCFAHSVMNDIINNVDNIAVCSAEDLQIAKYNNGGSYDYHHDGYGRYLTCLCYLNGIGGTYFPFANMSKNELDGIDFTNENEVSVLSLKKQFDKCGMLIVGEEGQDAYLQSSFVKPKTIIQIDAGDAIAFYNYMPSGEKDLRQLHCSLPVPQEKWIATSWLRSDALTGPFALMKKAQLFGSWRGC